MEVYCGVDLHARRSQVCVIDRDGAVLVNRKVPNRIEVILGILEPFGKGFPVAVESTFNWYWLVDALQDAGHEVHLGHPLKLAMISKAKTKTDRVLTYDYVTKGMRKPGSYPYYLDVRAVPPAGEDYAQSLALPISAKPAVLAHDLGFGWVETHFGVSRGVADTPGSRPGKACLYGSGRGSGVSRDL